MALDGTYSGLQASIADWLARSGDFTISTVAPDLILLFEEEARDRLRTRFQETNATLTTVGGTATLALPADYWEAREIKITSTVPIAELVYMTPEQLDAVYSENEVGLPVNYTIEGLNLRFGPVPDAAYTVNLLYMQGLVALKTADHNWLINDYPSLYLFGSLAMAELYIGNDERVAGFIQAMERGFERVRQSDIKARWSAGTLTVQTDTLNP